MRFYGTIQDGRAVLEKPHLYQDFIKTLKEGDKVQIEVKVRRAYRSLPQNALYWMWLTLIGEELGYDKEEVHDSFKAMFLTNRELKIPLVRSTTKLDTLDFTIYLDKIKLFCNDELGIILPTPDEIYS